MEPVVNKVAQSELVVFRLEDLWDNRDVVIFDLAPMLVEGLVLREKLYREAIETYDWTPFQDAHAGIVCSTDAIVPTWAYMLAASKLVEVARSVTFGDEEAVRTAYFDRVLEAMDWSTYENRPVIVKGCSSRLVPASSYVRLTIQLQNIARKVMFGEPCSTVPVWKRPKTRS